MLVGFLFKSKEISYSTAFLYIGFGVAAVGALVLLVRLVVKETGEAPAETSLGLAGA